MTEVIEIWWFQDFWGGHMENIWKTCFSYTLDLKLLEVIEYPNVKYAQPELLLCKEILKMTHQILSQYTFR